MSFSPSVLNLLETDGWRVWCFRFTITYCMQAIRMMSPLNSGIHSLGRLVLFYYIQQQDLAVTGAGKPFGCLITPHYYCPGEREEFVHLNILHDDIKYTFSKLHGFTISSSTYFFNVFSKIIGLRTLNKRAYNSLHK